jgi:hypothetical protein
MRIFDRKLSLFLLFISIPLLFLPKINLVKIQDETAGLRIDDLAIFFFAFIASWGRLMQKERMLRIELWLIILVLFSFFSFAANRLFVLMDLLHLDAKIFYCVRIAEYFMFFYVGMLLSQFLRARTIIMAFFVWNALLMFLQKAEIVGEFSSLFGYNEVSGIASFPSEMGFLLDMIFCYFLFDDSYKKQAFSFSLPLQQVFEQLYIYGLFILFAVLIIWTGSRIAIVALTLPFLYKIKDIVSRSVTSLMIGVIFLSCTVGLMLFSINRTDSVSKRSESLVSLNNLKVVQLVWNAQNIEDKPLEGELDGKDEESDLSWLIRINKWCYVIKVYLNHPECYLQGVGPGFSWQALDGGMVRIFVEYGLIGAAIFTQIFAAIYRKNEQLKWIIIVFLINMIFFDVYLAYKAMSVLFFITGYTYAVSLKKEETSLSPMLCAGH